MMAARTPSAATLFTIMAATTLLGRAQGCYTTGEAVDIDAGCASAGQAGSCDLGSSGIFCNDGTSGSQVCGGSCSCSSSVCMEDATNQVCAEPYDAAIGTGGDPHMTGLQGQKIDWKGQDGGWYVLLSEPDAGLQISLRLTAPLPTEFPDRQLITGLALKSGDGHSIVIQTKNPYTTETTGCRGDVSTPCLSEDALKITVDGNEHQAVPTENLLLPGGTVMTATNLPTECQPYGGDVIWATNFFETGLERHLADVQSLDEWVLGWSATTAAPSWCEKFLADSGTEGLLGYHSNHAVFRIETPSFTVRLHHGTNHQGGEIVGDGRTLPELEFWQMDVHLEWFDLNADTVTGILGETIRPVLDSEGSPIMYGAEALRGDVEDYRVSGPLEEDFPGSH